MPQTYRARAESYKRPHVRPLHDRGMERHFLTRLRGRIFAASLLPVLGAAAAMAQDPTPAPTDAARRLQVLFVGAPTENGPHHDPITRYRTLKRGLGTAGIDLTYDEDPAHAFAATFLAHFDAVLLYGNWPQMGTMPQDQLDALVGFVEGGGGFAPVHCGSACWGRSPRFVRLVGGRFREHGGEEFTVTNVAPDHPVLAGLPSFRAWDETYVHDEHADDRTILQTRSDEPWTWVRTQGKGRVFYTAAGHDHRVWDLPEFWQLLRNGILWAAGDGARERLAALQLPKLEDEDVLLPGYRERRAITRAQKPLPPLESAKLVQVPPDMQLQLFASEPDIRNPIHVAWDARGRAFVTETVDYPNNLQTGDLGHDRITICEDTDGDGKADRFTRFAENLSIPTSLTFVGNAVVCTNGPDMLWLEDTDGDDRADVRKVLFTGFHMGDTHAGVSNLRQGPDGWIWATIGYSGFRGTVGGQQHEFAQGVLRFRPDGSALEFVQNTTNNTWGLGFTAAGDVLGSTANGNPSWFHTVPIAVCQAVGLEPRATPRADDNPRILPTSDRVRQADWFEFFTAAAGHAIATGALLPSEWNDRTAFVCEPTAKLVARFDLQRRGAGFTARQAPNNLFASADEWTSPVCAEIGPDGAVWICDWYNLIIQHNPAPTRGSAGIEAKTGRGNAYETPLRDTRHGRIWRVFPRGKPAAPFPQLSSADTAGLVEALAHPHHGIRLHAQWLLTNEHDATAVPALLARMRAGGLGASHALRVLATTGALPATELETALRSPDEALARAALAHADVAVCKRALVRDGKLAATGRMLAELLVRFAGGAADPDIGAALYHTAKAAEAAVFADPVLRDAWTIAARRHADTVLAAAIADGFEPGSKPPSINLLPNADFSLADGDAPQHWGDLQVYNGADAPTVRVRHTATAGRKGTPCLEITTAKASDCGVFVTVPVAPASRYRLSGWVRTENLEPRNRSFGAMMNIHTGSARTEGVTGTTDWTRVACEFETGDETTVMAQCLFGGWGGARGTAWWDDVVLEPLGTGNTLPGALGMLVAASAGTVRTAAATPAERTFAPDPEVHARGAAVYARTCIACHGIDGKGLAPVFPPLDGSDWLTGESRRPIDIVLHGLMGPVTVAGTRYDSMMAPLGAMLNDDEIAAVLTLVRQRWSNDAAPVTAAEVAARRAANRERSLPWTAEELQK